MPKLVIMDQGGDMTKTWDEETRSQTEEIFNDLVRNQGYWAFIPDRSGKRRIRKSLRSRRGCDRLA